MRALVLTAILLVPASARAEVGAGASIGYARPFGDAARGARVSDATYGLVPIRVDVGAMLTRAVGASIALQYALAIPTLCATASDCIASAGSDVAISVRARFGVRRFGRLEPFVDVGPGYEWLTTRLVDASAESTHGYRGPIATIEAFAPLRLGGAWTIAPVVSATAGIFAVETLEAPGVTTRGNAVGHTLHGWIALALRIGFAR